MEDYYKCSNVNGNLMYQPLFGKKRAIPIILVNDGGNIFEFFTKTKFILKKNGYYSGFELPNSTLFYSLNSSNSCCCYKIFPSDALKELEPFMKNPSKYIKQINSYFDSFRNEFIRRQQETERMNRENSDAQSILSKFWKSH